MTDTLEISDVRAGEMGQCLELVKLSVIELASDHHSDEQIKAWVNQYPSSEVFATWQRRRKMLVARENDVLVGFGQIQFDRNEIVGVHVAPTKVRSGIGSLLVDELEKSGIKAGITEIVIQASLNAVAFYKSCGYLSVKSIEFEYSNGVKTEALFMRKNLIVSS